MDKGIQQNIGSSNPNFLGFSSYHQREGQLLPLNTNLDNFGSNGDYGLVDENVGNQNEVEQEFTFPTQPIPRSNEFMPNYGMCSFMSYDQSNPLTNFASMSESSLSQGSDFSNYRGSFSTSFTSAAQSMSLDNSDMYQDNLTLTLQSISRQGSQLSNYQDNLLANVTQTRPLSQGPNLFSQQSNLSTYFAFNPQSTNQGADISYQNSLTKFASTTSQSFNQESSNLSYYHSNLFGNFNSTPQPWNHQGFNPQYPHQPNLVTNIFSSLSPPLTQEYDPSYQTNLTTNFFSTPQSVSQVPDLSYHENNSSINLSFTPQSLNQGSSSTNFTYFTPQSLNKWSSLHPLNHNNPSFNLTSTPQPLNQGSSWCHLNHDNPSSNFTFIPQSLNEGSLSLPLNHDNPSTNFTFTSQPLNQVSSVLPLNHDFNNLNENLIGFLNERDDCSFNYLLAYGGQQSSQHGEAVGATSVSFSYNPTVVQQNPNMVQTSPVMPQNNNYNLLLKTMTGAPTINAVTPTPPQPPRAHIGGPLRSGNRSAAARLTSNTQLFGQGLLGYYQALSSSIARGFGRGTFPYGHYRHSWRKAIIESILIAGNGPHGGSRMAAATAMQQGSTVATMQQGSTTAGGVMMDKHVLQAPLASPMPTGLRRIGAASYAVEPCSPCKGEFRPRWMYRLPANLVTGGNNVAPLRGAAAEAGRGRGGERRGRKKKSTGITIYEGGRPRETGVTINEGGRSVCENPREGEGQGKGKETAVQVASRKGKEKVAEGVQGRSSKGNEKLPIIEKEEVDDDDDILDMVNFLNWQEYTNIMSLTQTSSSQQGPPPPPPPAFN